MAAIHTYQMPQAASFVLGVRETLLMNYPLYRTDFKLFKNVTNEVRVFVRDADRKPVNPTSKTLICNIVDEDELVLSRTLEPIDALRGLLNLKVMPHETAHWRTGYYKYSITVRMADGQETLLYTDQAYRPHSYLEVVDGPVPLPVASIEILPGDFRIVSEGTPLQDYRVAEAYPGAAQVGHVAGVHGVAVYTTGYEGTFWMQASLENQVPTNENEWFNVPLDGATSYTFGGVAGVTGITYFTAVGNFMWVRFRLLNAGQNLGTVDKILYRN